MESILNKLIIEEAKEKMKNKKNENLTYGEIIDNIKDIVNKTYITATDRENFKLLLTTLNKNYKRRLSKEFLINLSNDKNNKEATYKKIKRLIADLKTIETTNITKIIKWTKWQGTIKDFSYNNNRIEFQETEQGFGQQQKEIEIKTYNVIDI